MAWFLWALGLIYGPSLLLLVGVGAVALVSRTFSNFLIGERRLPHEIDAIARARHEEVQP